MKAYIYPRPRPYGPGAIWSVQTSKGLFWDEYEIWSYPKDFDTREEAEEYARSITQEIRVYGEVKTNEE